MVKRTKIVATIGPSSRDLSILKKLVLAGANVFRLNFSHGDHSSHLEIIKRIKQIRKELGYPVAILQDLSGPKIRIGKIKNEPLQLKVNDRIILDASLKTLSEGNRIGLNYPDFASDVSPDSRLLLADGEIELVVEAIHPPQVYCRVLTGGNLTSAKGINFPTGSFKVAAITTKDKQDLQFGLKNGIDLVALSFVRSAQDIRQLRQIMKEAGRLVPVIAKIEKHEAIDNIDEIIEEADAIMIARGDLGVEIEIEKIPIVQKRILTLSQNVGKPVITATQMLKSMVVATRPTRAEVTDVANAILDGTDAVMLSEETAIGRYPERVVQVMKNIAYYTEEFYFEKQHNKITPINIEKDFTLSIAHSAVILAQDIKASVILAITRTGYTAKMIARFRPQSRILALTPSQDTFYQLSMVWGVIPVVCPHPKNANHLFKEGLKIAHKRGLIKKGDHYVIISGYPLEKPRSINQIKAGRFD